MKRLQFTFKWRFIQSYYLVRLFLFLLRDQFDCHNVCCIAVIFYLDSWIPVCLSVCSGMNEETLNLEVAPYWRIVNMYFSPPPPSKNKQTKQNIETRIGQKFDSFEFILQGTMCDWKKLTFAHPTWTNLIFTANSSSSRLLQNAALLQCAEFS